MPRFWKKRKKAIVFAGLMFLQALLLSLQIPLGQEASVMERAAFTAFAPVQRTVRGLFRDIGEFWTHNIYLRRVEAQNRAYRDELFRLRQENALLRNGLGRLQLRDEAAAFLLGLRSSFVLADIIGVDTINPYKSVVIDVGTSEGVRAQMPVVDGRGRLVGRVIAPISAGEATVQLVTDNNSAVSVRGADHPVSGLLAGDPSSGRGWLTYVPASEESLVPGEILLTTGFDRIFPAGLEAGVILSVSSDGSLFKKIAVQPSFEIRDQKIVAVLTAAAGGGE